MQVWSAYARGILHNANLWRAGSQDITLMYSRFYGVLKIDYRMIRQLAKTRVSKAGLSNYGKGSSRDPERFAAAHYCNVTNKTLQRY